jgi:hypothetical protein
LLCVQLFYPNLSQEEPVVAGVSANPDGSSEAASIDPCNPLDQGNLSSSADGVLGSTSAPVRNRHDEDDDEDIESLLGMLYSVVVMQAV